MHNASVAVNSLGLVDLIQIAARGLSPKSEYRVYLTNSAREPFGTLEPLAVLRTNPDGAGIVQAIAPLKSLSNAGAKSVGASRRFLVVTDVLNPDQVVLRTSIQNSEN